MSQKVTATPGPPPEDTVFVGKQTPITRFLGGIETVGNKLPHPLYLFLIIAALIALTSAIVAATGATTVDPKTGEDVAIKSLLSSEGIVYMFTMAIENFVTFPPLGLIITVMLGIGVAEKTGLLSTFMRGAVLSAPPWAVTFAVVLISIMGNLASDTAMVIIPPLAAIAFLACGRHPLAGFMASYAAVTAGFSANFIPAGTDVLLAGITTSSAQIVDPDMVISPLANWFFMSVSAIVLTIAITLTCQYLVEPRLGKYEGAMNEDSEPLSAAEKRGLVTAVGFIAVYLAVLVALIAVPTSPFRGENGAILQSPFMESVPIFILLFFLIGGISYGLAAKTLTSAAQIPEMMTETVKTLVPYIVVIFAAAQAIAWFAWSNIGLLIATGGASFLESAGLDGIMGLTVFSVLVAVPALLLSSGSALWTLLGPVFVPMFMLAGIDPAYTQAAFRITDSATNTLVPLNPMLPVILGLMQRYVPKGGLGTLFSLVIPFTLVIWVVWLILFLIWGGFGLPVGPGHSLHL